MMLGKIIFDHRPPLALRAEGTDANDPDRLVAICVVCNDQKTPRDIREIARARRLAIGHQDFISRMADKVPGRPVPSRTQRRKLDRALMARPERVEHSGDLPVSSGPHSSATAHDHDVE
jgi:hypothetical protein